MGDAPKHEFNDEKLKIYLIENILSTLKNLSFPNVDFTLSQPKNKSFGDLSSNLPLIDWKSSKKTTIRHWENDFKRFERKK